MFEPIIYPLTQVTILMEFIDGNGVIHKFKFDDFDQAHTMIGAILLSKPRKMFEKIVVTIGQYKTIVSDSILSEQNPEIDFDGALKVRLERMYDEGSSIPIAIGYKVVNAMDGYGINVREQYVNEQVIMEPLYE